MQQLTSKQTQAIGQAIAYINRYVEYAEERASTEAAQRLIEEQAHAVIKTLKELI